jgi:hypothetical protein
MCAKWAGTSLPGSKARIRKGDEAWPDSCHCSALSMTWPGTVTCTGRAFPKWSEEPRQVILSAAKDLG